MNILSNIWSILFRLFPCPTRVGLRRIGNPGRPSPVLVTCNFSLTVKRLMHILHGLNLWLLVAQSKGVNVWCAAGGDEFNTHSVVSAVKTSGIADLVDHRRLILPPLGAPGINATDVSKQTGWGVHWGPVRGEDLPRYLVNNDCHRDESMKRVTYNWRERIDTALGSMFPFYLMGAIGFLIFGRHLLLDYLVIGAVTFLLFMLACPWIPGKRGLTKVLFLEVILGIALISSEFLFSPSGFSVCADLIIAMAMLLVYGAELGGLAPNMTSELDPFLARLGIGAVGNLALAGTIRTELLNGYRELTHDRGKCTGCRSCFEVCPQGVWEFDKIKMAVLAHKESCTACRACLVQCDSGAIQAVLKSN